MMLMRQAGEIARALSCSKGAAMVEYAILAAMLGLVASVALTSLGTNIKTMFTALAGKV